MGFALSLLMAAGPVGAELSAPVAPLAATEAASFVLTTVGHDSVLLDGCAPVELERREGESWVAVPRRPCPQRPAATVVQQSLVLSVPPPGPGEFRAVVAYGVGCRPSRPFAFAACEVVEVVRSNPFRVEQAAVSPAP